ncbi:MAG TPA: class I fructose-bisphosphate aldolase [Candidatus Polarisedimenticolaceae bacterium]|nr:class I fructose-bisphosphate aldolase [Candidatus Polarisedimenticolaceae bacterium]
MEYAEQLKKTAQAMMAEGRGLLAADESTATIAKRFKGAAMENTEEHRRQYRQLLLETKGAEAFISGVILYDETARQKDDQGKPFVDGLTDQGIVPGIKVDIGPRELALHPGEKVTEGLDGLGERFAEYAKMGIGFSKWRAVIIIDGNELPSQACLEANAHALARYAALAQEAGIVPIVEPEVLMDGSHSMERCLEVTGTALDALFAQLMTQGVMLEGTILKPSMVIGGSASGTASERQAVAEQTVKCLKEHVPRELAGVMFLSGGQSDEEATAHLDAMNKIGDTPWPLSFSYGRALQNPVLEWWAKGDSDKARAAYLHRAEANSLAAKGQWTEGFEDNRPY